MTDDDRIARRYRTGGAPLTPRPGSMTAFLEQLAQTNGGQLEAWQQRFLEAAHAGERLTFAMPRSRGGKQLALDVIAAHTIASGEPVLFAAASREQAEAARRRALDVLDTLDHALER